MKKTEKIINSLIEEIEKMSNVSVACQKVGIARKTFYEWMNQDPYLKERVTEAKRVGRESICDVAQNSILKLAQSGDFRASKYILDKYSKRFIDYDI